MTDYGMRTKPKSARGLWIGLIVFVVIAGVVGHLAIRALQPKWIAESRAWTVKGPPCPTVTEAAFKARTSSFNAKFEYDDVVFTHAYGQGSCAQLHDKGGAGFGRISVCQFSAPRALSAHGSKAEAFYVMEVGQPVSVTIDHGAVACVLGASQFPPPG